jgi:hypothetical protein
MSFEDGLARIPEAGDWRAIIRALDACGLAMDTEAQGESQIRMHCPNVDCTSRNKKTWNWSCFMEIETTRWVCFKCRLRPSLNPDLRDANPFDRKRHLWNGNLMSLLDRMGVYRKWIDGEIVYYMREDARAGTARNGSKANIAKQLEATYVRVNRGDRTTDIVAHLQETYGLSRTVAYDRIRVIKGGKGGKRTQSASPFLRRQRMMRLIDEVRSSEDEVRSLGDEDVRSSASRAEPPSLEQEDTCGQFVEQKSPTGPALEGELRTSNDEVLAS